MIRESEPQIFVSMIAECSSLQRSRNDIIAANENSTALAHSKWYNFRDSKFEVQQIRERGIEHG